MTPCVCGHPFCPMPTHQDHTPGVDFLVSLHPANSASVYTFTTHPTLGRGILPPPAAYPFKYLANLFTLPQYACVGLAIPLPISFAACPLSARSCAV